MIRGFCHRVEETMRLSLRAFIFILMTLFALPSWAAPTIEWHPLQLRGGKAAGKPQTRLPDRRPVEMQLSASVLNDGRIAVQCDVPETVDFAPHLTKKSTDVRSEGDFQ
jgi:hypothetical protein